MKGQVCTGVCSVRRGKGHGGVIVFHWAKKEKNNSVCPSEGHVMVTMFRSIP